MEDTALIPSLGGFHMLQSNLAHVPQLLSLRSRAWEWKLVSPLAATTKDHVPRAHAPQQEKPSQWEAWALQWRVALTKQQRPTSAKNK